MSESRKGSASLSHSQVSSLETMLSTLPWPRCMQLRTTLLSSGPCILQRFLRSLWRGRSRLGLRLLPLLTMAAPHPWCLSHSRVRRGGDAKVWHPFRLPPGALVANEGGGGAEVLLTRFRLHCGWGVACQHAGRLLQQSPGCCPSCRTGVVPHPLQGHSSSSRSHPDIVSNVSGRVSSAPGGREDVQGHLGIRP